MATTPQELDAEEARRSLTRNQVLAAVGILFVVLLLLWFFVFKGGGEDPASAPVAPIGAPPSDATPAPVDNGNGNGDGDNEKGNVETFTVFAPKDPFKPLITSADAAGGGTTTDTTGTATGTDTGNGTGDGSGNGTGTGTGDTGDGTGTGSTDGSSIGGHRVKLIDVFASGDKERASIQVDGTVYTVDVGEEFADSFKLLSTSGDCASLLFGDDQFSLCEGQEILK